MIVYRGKDTCLIVCVLSKTLASGASSLCRFTLRWYILKEHSTAAVSDALPCCLLKKSILGWKKNLIKILSFLFLTKENSNSLVSSFLRVLVHLRITWKPGCVFRRTKLRIHPSGRAAGRGRWPHDCNVNMHWVDVVYSSGSVWLAISTRNDFLNGSGHGLLGELWAHLGLAWPEVLSVPPLYSLLLTFSP